MWTLPSPELTTEPGNSVGSKLVIRGTNKGISGFTPLWGIICTQISIDFSFLNSPWGTGGQMSCDRVLDTRIQAILDHRVRETLSQEMGLRV
jgi:hypothetical protein